MSRILAFGYHDQSAPRHWTISRQMLDEGFELIECHTSAKGLFGKYRDLYRQFRTKGRDIRALLVTFPGHYLMPLAWLLTRWPRRRWLIFDAFVSLHDTAVDDRKTVGRRSPKAFFLYLVDWFACHLADTVLVDTEAHRDFFIDRFRLRPDRVRVIYLGARTDIFHPKKDTEQKKRDTFDVLFIGTFIPLQGVDVILRAAKALQRSAPDVRFTLIGKGQTYPAMKAWADTEGLTNVRFEGPLPYLSLPDRIRAADVCLGIFGTSGKASRVIPHKVYDAVACGVPVITADTEAIREKFAEDPLVTLVTAGDSGSLAKAITLARARRTR